MKKVLIAIAIVLGLGLAGAGVYFYQNSRGTFTIEQIVPKGTWAYARFSDVDKRLSNFKSTLLWKNIDAIDVPKLLEKSGLSAKQIESSGYSNFKKFLSDPRIGAILAKFFGKEFAVTLFPVEIKEFNVNSLETFLASVTVITRLRPDAQVAETLAALFKEADSSLKTSVIEYKNHKITLIEVPKQNLSFGYVRIKDLLVFGVGDKPAKRCLDVIAKDTPAITTDPAFVKAKSKYLPAAQTVAYGNIEFIYHDMLRLALASSGNDDSAQTERIKSEMEKILKKVTGFEAIGYSSVDTPLLTQKLDVLYDKAKLDPKVKKVYSFLPEENKTLKFIPKDVIGYKWSNALDLKNQWEAVKEEFESLKSEDAPAFSIDQITKAIEKSLKLNIETDILPAVGNEVGGYLSDISMEGFVPLPKLLLFVKTADRAAMEKILETVSSNPQFVLQNDNYKNIPIKYIALPLGEDLQPGYCFFNDYLLFATSRTLLRQALDVADTSASSIETSPPFKGVNLSSTDKTNDMLFLDLDAVWNKSRVLIQWWTAQIKARVSQQQAFKAGMEKRLVDAEQSLKMEAATLADLKTALQAENNHLKQLQTQGLDVAETLVKIDQLENKIEDQNDTIQNAQNDQDEITDSIQTFKEEKTDPELAQMYVNEVVFPLLDGLSEYKALGSKIVFGPEALESTTYIKKQ